MINVIGLDLSVTASGVCFADNSAVTLKPRTTGDARFVEIPDRITEFCHAAYIRLAVIEEAPPGLKGAAIPTIHGVQAVVRAALIRQGIPYVVVNPSTLKKFATGQKVADKIAMAMAAYKRAGLEFADDNACDAWWLRLAGATYYDPERTSVAMPKAHRDALNAVAWPALKDLPRVAV
jgi:Holliday junction resolvasome RuvABC endonuclease subunit